MATERCPACGREDGRACHPVDDRGYIWDNHLSPPASGSVLARLHAGEPVQPLPPLPIRSEGWDGQPELLRMVIQRTANNHYNCDGGVNCDGTCLGFTEEEKACRIIRDLLPYAESRAEDMTKEVDAMCAAGTREDLLAESRQYAAKAWLAVEAGHAFLGTSSLALVKTEPPPPVPGLVDLHALLVVAAEVQMYFAGSTGYRGDLGERLANALKPYADLLPRAPVGPGGPPPPDELETDRNPSDVERDR